VNCSGAVSFVGSWGYQNGPRQKVLTVTSVSSGVLAVGQVLSGNGITAGTTISGMMGNDDVASVVANWAGDKLQVVAVNSGGLDAGQPIVASVYKSIICVYELL